MGRLIYFILRFIIQRIMNFKKDYACNPPKPLKFQHNTLSFLLHENTKQGFINSWEYPQKVKSGFARTHQLTYIKLNSKTKVHNSVKWADLDPVEHRYLILAQFKTGLELYDTDKAWTTNIFNHIGSIKLNHPSMHTEQVTCIQWYPYDAGLILSSCYSEKRLKIWDPNILTLADEFRLPSPIAHHDMSSVASGHSLIATALSSGEVVLCDLRSGSASHSLRSKKQSFKPASFVQWSKHDQNILASGGDDNLIRIWDVRFARACLKVLNETYSDRGSACSLSFTYDGLWLVTLSSYPKNCISVWNTKTFKRRKVNFKFKEEFVPQKPHRIDLTRNLYPDCVYIPSLGGVYVYNLSNGSLVNVLKCHDRAVNGVIYNPVSNDLYAFGGKKNLMVFSPQNLIPKKPSDFDLEMSSVKRIKTNEGQYSSPSLPNGISRQYDFDFSDRWSSDSD